MVVWSRLSWRGQVGDASCPGLGAHGMPPDRRHATVKAGDRIAVGNDRGTVAWGVVRD
jgi:hypothetical protein